MNANLCSVDGGCNAETWLVGRETPGWVTKEKMSKLFFTAALLSPFPGNGVSSSPLKVSLSPPYFHTVVTAAAGFGYVFLPSCLHPLRVCARALKFFSPPFLKANSFLLSKVKGGTTFFPLSLSLLSSSCIQRNLVSNAFPSPFPTSSSPLSSPLYPFPPFVP